MEEECCEGVEDEAVALVHVRRHWNDWKKGAVRFDRISGLNWDRMSGGVGGLSPHLMVYGYITCTDLVEGEIAHSGVHGPCPHRIKVVVVKKDNERPTYDALVAQCGPKPSKRSARQNTRPESGPGGA